MGGDYMATIRDGKIYYTPDELGYQDRGKLKWMGMMLSDHTEALKKLKQTDHTVQQITPKPQMSFYEISMIFKKSYDYQSPIRIQSNIINQSDHYEEIPCIVLGYKDNYIYLKKINGEIRKCQLEEIRYAECIEPMEWYNKQPYLSRSNHDFSDQ